MFNWLYALIGFGIGWLGGSAKAAEKKGAQNKSLQVMIGIASIAFLLFFKKLIKSSLPLHLPPKKADRCSVALVNKEICKADTADHPHHFSLFAKRHDDL